MGGLVASSLWGVILGGGIGDRRAERRASRFTLRRPPAARHVLFRQAVERAARLIEPQRLLAVLARDHSASYDIELASLPPIQRVVQPVYRGSGPEIFLPVLKIADQDPDATIVILPSDHLVDGEARLMTCVAKAAQAVAARPDLPLVIGAHPSGPDAAASWIEPGAPVEGLECFGVRAVQRFVRRPAPADLATLWEGHGLVNTHVVIARARALIRLGQRYLPDVLETFEPLAGAFGAPEESLLCEAVYEQMPYATVSHALFVRAQDIAVLPATNVTMWSEVPPPEVETLAS
jgi:mannose-1-phosphate guanylyltransferase